MHAMGLRSTRAVILTLARTNELPLLADWKSLDLYRLHGCSCESLSSQVVTRGAHWIAPRFHLTSANSRARSCVSIASNKYARGAADP